MFLREVVTGKRTGRPVRYAQLVEAYRNEEGKSRHRVLLSLGRVDAIDRESLQRLVTGLSRYLGTGEVPAGGRVGRVREFGVVHLADALWKRLGLPDFFRRQLRRRRYDAPVERALFAMVAHRVADPGSKLACHEWLERDAFLPDGHRVALQHLYRAMDFLDDSHEALEGALFEQRRSLFDEVQLVHYDTTSTYFDGDDTASDDVEYGLRQYGHSKDYRGDRRQIVLGLAVDQQGLPIVSEVFSGETGDQLTVVPMLERLRKLGLRRVVWVADRGMTSSQNLAAVTQAGLGYVVGVKLRSDEALRDAILADRSSYTVLDDGLQVKELRLADKRHVVCFSPETAVRDLATRNRAIARVGAFVQRVNARSEPASEDEDTHALSTNGFYRRLVSRGPDGRFHLDKNKLDREAQCDGTFVLEVGQPDLPPKEAAKAPRLSAAQAAQAYKGLLRVERSFRVLKNGLDLRPVYHRLDKRIRAHVTLCLLAYLLERTVELATRAPFEQTRKDLAQIRAVELTVGKTTVWEASAPGPQAQAVFEALKLPAPPRLLPSLAPPPEGG